MELLKEPSVITVVKNNESSVRATYEKDPHSEGEADRKINGENNNT